MKKLSEKYLERISHSTEFSKPVVLTKHVKTYGEICRLEEALEVYKHLIGLGGHHYDNPTMFHMQDREKAIEQELEKIAKREKII